MCPIGCPIPLSDPDGDIVAIPCQENPCEGVVVALNHDDPDSAEVWITPGAMPTGGSGGCTLVSPDSVQAMEGDGETNEGDAVSRWHLPKTGFGQLVGLAAGTQPTYRCANPVKVVEKVGCLLRQTRASIRWAKGGKKGGHILDDLDEVTHTVVAFRAAAQSSNEVSRLVGRAVRLAAESDEVVLKKFTDSWEMALDVLSDSPKNRNCQLFIKWAKDSPAAQEQLGLLQESAGPVRQFVADVLEKVDAGQALSQKDKQMLSALTVELETGFTRLSALCKQAASP